MELDAKLMQQGNPNNCDSIDPQFPKSWIMRLTWCHRWLCGSYIGLWPLRSCRFDDFFLKLQLLNIVVHSLVLLAIVTVVLGWIFIGTLSAELDKSESGRSFLVLHCFSSYAGGGFFSDSILEALLSVDSPKTPTFDVGASPRKPRLAHYTTPRRWGKCGLTQFSSLDQGFHNLVAYFCLV